MSGGKFLDDSQQQAELRAKEIILSSEQIDQLRKQCKELDVLRALPDAIASGLSTVAPILGPAAILLEAQVAIYSGARYLGFDPVGPKSIMCEAMDDFERSQKIPTLVKKDAQDAATLSIILKPGEQLSAQKKVVKKKLTKMGILSDGDQEKIIQAALKHAKLPLNKIEEKLDSVLQWQTKRDEEQKTQEEKHVKLQKKQQTYQDIEQTLDLFNQLGAITACRELQQFTIVAAAGVKIYQCIDQLSLLKGFAINPVIGIANAVLSIFSLFMRSGPDPTEIILKQISKLSEQIEGLQKIMIRGFNNNAEMLREIFQTVVVGFSKLSQQLDRQFNGLRVEMHVALNNIVSRLDFLTRYMEIVTTDNHLEKFNKLSNKVRSYLQGTYEQNTRAGFQRASEELIGLVKEKANDKLLTGITFFEAKPIPEKIKGVLEGMDEARINFFLGFFARYAQQRFAMVFDEKLDPTIIPNPEVWFKAVQNYIELQTVFPQLDIDPDDRQLEQMIVAGQHVLDFADRIKTDVNFWETLLNHYHACLVRVRTKVKKYAADYSATELGKLNDNRRTNFIAPDAKDEQNIASLNLLASPDEFIAQFDRLSLAHLGDIETLGRLKAVTPLPQDSLSNNKRPIYDALRAQSLNTLLCAESIGALSFSAAQAGEIGGFERRGTNLRRLLWSILPLPPVDEGKVYVAAKWYPETRRWIGSSMQVTPAHWWYPRGVGQRGDPGYNAELGPINLQNPNWTLPIQMAAKINNATYPVGVATFSGQWSGARAEAAVYVENEEWIAPVNIGGNYYAICRHCTGRGIEIFYSEYSKFVAQYWRQPAGRSLTSRFIRDNNQLEQMARQKINEYYVQQRKAIIANLTSPIASHTRVASFKEELTELDITVHLIRWYAYLMGKEKNAPILANLVTSDKVTADLKKYADDQTLPKQWLTCISQALRGGNKISYAVIQGLPAAGKKPLVVNWFLYGQMRLRFYQGWKALYKQKFPTLSQFVDVQSHQCGSEFKPDERNKDKFSSAKTKLANRDKISDLAISKEQYEECSRSILGWATEDSVTSNFLNCTADGFKDLDSVEAQQFAKYLQSYGWSSSIYFLICIAVKYGNCQFPDGMSGGDSGKVKRVPANFAMWQEGTRAYLDLIVNNSNEKINTTARAAGSSDTVRLKAVTDLQEVGLNLQATIATIAQSFDLFDFLFNRYLQVIGELCEFIKDKLIVENSAKSSKFDVCNLLANDVYRGARDKILNQLTAYGIWITSYLEIAFGYDIEKLPASKIKLLATKEEFTLYTDQKSLLKFLETNNHQEKLVEALEIYIKQIERLRGFVLLRIAYIKDISLLKTYLEKYSQNNKVADTLKISNKISMFALTDDKIDLIDQFLKQNNRIRIVEVEGVLLSDNRFKALKQMLLQHPNIVLLRLKDCFLPSNSVALGKNGDHELSPRKPGQKLMPVQSKPTQLKLDLNLGQPALDQLLQELANVKDKLQSNVKHPSIRLPWSLNPPRRPAPVATASAGLAAHAPSPK